MEPSSSSSNFTDPLTGFYHSLTKEIDTLESTLQSDNNDNDFMSMQFLESVLNLTHFCHDQMTHFALTLKLPASGAWSDEYMEESNKLRKASEDIKDSVERMENYYDDCLSITTFLDTNRVLDHEACYEMITSITDCIAEAELLEQDNTPISTNWLDLGLIEKVWSETVLHENFGFNGIIYAARNVTNTLVRILLYGLVYCWPDYKFKSYVYENGVLYDSSFMVSTDRLQQRVESEIYKLTRPTILWFEFWRSKVALVELSGKFETKCDDLQDGGVVCLDLDDGGVNGIVENLKGYIGVLKEGGERIIQQIDDFVDDIIEARKKVFDLQTK